MEDKNTWMLKFEECEPANRLITKIKKAHLITEKRVDIMEIKKAIYYARKYHGTQMRQSGEPYYHRTVEVAIIGCYDLFRTDLLVTSILHDTIEDTSLTRIMISDIFGKISAEQVEDLTRIKFDRKISAEETLDILFAQHKNEILSIKLFDRLHNMRTIGAKSPEKGRKIVDETLNYFLPIAAHIGLRDVEEELRQICARIIEPNKPQLQTRRFFNSSYQLPSLVSQNEIERKKSQ